MNDHDHFNSLFRAHADPMPDDGFTERVIGRIRYRAKRRRAILAATMTLAIAAATAAAWMFPTRALVGWDVRSTIAVLLLSAASGLIAVGTETSPPARRAPLSRR